MIEAFQQLPPAFFIGFLTLLGLLVGSFLNVVIYRLPKMMDKEQEEAAAEFIEQKISQKESVDFIPLESTCPQCHHHFAWSKGIAVSPEKADSAKKPAFNLMTPGSSCPKCGHKIRWWENVPVLSWLFLRGRCSSCRTPISARYPAVELLTGILFGFVAWRLGTGWEAFLWCFFVAMCVAISGIDWDTTWLPDELSLSLMWAGIIFAALGWVPLSLTSAVWGAVAGYMFLWTIATLFKVLMGKIAMANGDFKLFAALGAWFGWEWLLPIILVSSAVGAIVGILLKVMQSKAGLFEGKYVPFGPFLAGAGLLILLVTPQTIRQAFPFLFF